MNLKVLIENANCSYISAKYFHMQLILSSSQLRDGQLSSLILAELTHVIVRADHGVK